MALSMALGSKMARRKQEEEEQNITRYINKLLDITYSYTARYSNVAKVTYQRGFVAGNLVRYPVEDENKWDKEKWNTLVYGNDEITEQINERNQKEEKQEYNTYVEKYEYFKAELKDISDKLDEEMYFKTLVKLWDKLYARKDESYVIVNPFAEETDEARKDRLCKEKIFINYEKTIKEEMKLLDKRKPGIKNKCEGLINVYNNGCIKQLMFYKNELSPKGELTINIKECANMGVPHSDDSCIPYQSYIDGTTEKRKDVILRVWQECNIVIKKESYLYKYQKDIIDEGTEEIFEKAVNSGLYPDAIIEQALAHARKNNKKDKLPYLIWLNSKKNK